jgi:hypothetical protein
LTRFDYLRARFRHGAAPWGVGRVGAHAGAAAGVVVASLLLFAAAWTFDAQRLRGLNDDLEAAQLHVRATAGAARRALDLQAALERLRALDMRVALAQREAIDTTNAVARIGNDLPSQTWLTSVQALPGGGWSIAGRSTRIAEIGSALETIQLADGSGATHLVSASAGGRHRTLDFVIGWDAAR